METFLIKQKKEISRYLSEVLLRHSETLMKVHPIGGELCKKLLDFSLKGKMLRGGLVGIGYELYAEADPSVTVPLGAVQELFQSALLIHDDIMDRDLSRRGAPSILGHYVSLAEREGLQDAYHTGESLSICAGDIASFLAFEIFSRIPLKESLKTPLLTLCSQELAYVGAAQMMDVLWGADNTSVPVDQIINMYTYKTARYTYALPLMAGAGAAGAPKVEIAGLERLGTHMGVLFQIKDDDLGLFGDQEKLGKPVGSDIREGKKTLFHHFLMKDPDEAAREKTNSIFGRADITLEEIQFIRDRIDKLNIKEKIETISGEITVTAKHEIDKLDCSADGKELLSRLLSYNSGREK